MNRLILEDWHKTHEDIAGLLQYFKSNTSVESLFKAVFIKYEYLSYTDVFKIRCIWALGDINTSESKEKLKILGKLKDKATKENAKQQLKRMSLK